MELGLQVGQIVYNKNLPDLHGSSGVRMIKRRRL